MSNSTEYHLSATPEPYESALTLVGLTSEQYKVFTEESPATEEKYEEALEKLRVDKETRAEKLKDLQKKEEEWKVVEEKKKEEERQAAILKEKQEAEEKKKELDRLKVKEVADAVEKKKQDDLKKKKEEKKLRKEQKKVEKAAKATEAALVSEEKGTDVDTEGEMSEGAKKKALKKLKEI
ncbi:hypothetical protein EV421DRAFT_1914161 [Armillaria borealis]|uniref:Uncharacterized protein n=1 Tax=Armillaria borealis TaxID=47425 RepID=A0AA39IU19_9AGAR|nr:hypothetical protein EV421DRAFT_1914161 [Armillaria borealis]